MALSIDVIPWAHHGGQSVYSIDIDHKGRRAISAGFDSCSKVWNLDPFFSATAEGDETSNPRLLATLTGHYAPVNTARFANNRDLIATCSDDKHVYIYELLPGQGQASFGESPNLENWKHQHTLRGHSNNVVDVEWSPDDTLLASCSLDNLIIIWTATGKQVTVLKGHSSYVKGIAWDPAGSFLASQSDDKSMIIWRCSDWTSVQQVTDPFEKGMIFETFSLRLSWSTDGSALLGANSYQPPSHCAAVLHREKWESPLTIVGHRGAVTVISFNPMLFKSREDGDTEPAECFALGAQDRKVSVWLGSATRPIVVLRNFFNQSVTDLAWMPDGHSLLACSSDGQVAVLRFDKGTFGEPLSRTAKEEHLRNLYGKKQAGQSILLESSLLLNMPENGIAKPGPIGPPLSNPSLQHPQPPALNGTSKERLAASGNSRPNGAAKKQGPRQDVREMAAPPPAKMRRVVPEMTNGTPNPSGRQSLGSTLPSTAASLPGTSGRDLLWAQPEPPKLADIELGRSEDLSGTGRRVNLHIENTDSDGSIVCTEGETILWRDNVKPAVLRATGNLNFSAVALTNGSLIVYSAAGRRILPTIALGLPCYFLSAGKEWQLLAIQLDGLIHLWDLQVGRLVIKTHIPAIQNADVASAKLTAQGKPQIILADGSAYVLDLSLHTWLCVVDPAYAFTAFASLFPDALAKAGELGRIEEEASVAGQANAFAPNSRPITVSDSSRRHLESQVASALALESPKDYRRWLLTYVRHLAGEQSEGPLSEILDFLLGPLRNSPEVQWEDTILGLPKRGLLREVLGELCRHRTMQRHVTRYREMLDETEEPPS